MFQFEYAIGAKYFDYVFQGAGSEETHLSEDCSLWPLWPRLLPMGGAQKAQILNLLSFSPQACWCILQRSLQGSRGEMHFFISSLLPSLTQMTHDSLLHLIVLLLFSDGCTVVQGSRRHASEIWCFKG